MVEPNRSEQIPIQTDLQGANLDGDIQMTDEENKQINEPEQIQQLSAVEEVKQDEEKKIDEDAEEIETECNVCYTTMVEPCTLPCKHSFCLLCIRTFFQNKIECPLCRAVPPSNFKLTVNLAFQKQIKKMAPEGYQDQLKHLRAQNAFSGDFVDVRIVFGNRHEIVPARGNSENTHKWTMFVKIGNKGINANSLIEKVRFGLHPTFGMDYMDIKAGPSQKFEMGFTGWGTFGIPVTIHFKRELCLEPEKRQM